MDAGDKAGIAIITTAARLILNNYKIEHEPIRVALTPDQEIGCGVHPNLPKDLNVEFAYTFDGG